MRSSLRYGEPAFLEHLERGGFRLEFREKGDDGRFLLVSAKRG